MLSSYDLGSEFEDGLEVVIELAISCAKEKTDNSPKQRVVEQVIVMDKDLGNRQKRIVV